MGLKAETKNAIVKPYIQAQGGMTNYQEGVKANTSLELGARLNSGNLRAEAGVRGGTELGARAEVGYTVPLNGKKVGLDLSAGADYSKQLASSNTLSFTDKTPITYTQDGANYNFTFKETPCTKYEYTYKPDQYRAYAGAGVKVAPNNKFNITAGVEAGVKGTTLKDKMVEGQPYARDINETIPTSEGSININATVQGKYGDVTFCHPKPEAYVTPKIAAEYNINKNLSFGANASFNEAGVKAHWTF